MDDVTTPHLAVDLLKQRVEDLEETIKELQRDNEILQARLDAVEGYD